MSGSSLLLSCAYLNNNNKIFIYDWTKDAISFTTNVHSYATLTEQNDQPPEKDESYFVLTRVGSSQT